MQWFRLYNVFATDPKVQMMSEMFQRRLVMLFCIRSSNGDVTLQDQEVAFQLRISAQEWAETKAEFMRRNFIDKENNLLNWNKRQYISDSSNQRVKKHREKKKQECNVTVTPPDTEQNRTEQKKELLTEFEQIFWPIAAKKKSKGDARKAYLKARARADKDEIIVSWKAMNAQWLKKKKTADWQFVPYPASWLNDEAWADEDAKPPQQQPRQPEPPPVFFTAGGPQ